MKIDFLQTILALAIAFAATNLHGCDSQDEARSDDSVVFEQGFDQAGKGTLDENNLSILFNNPQWDNGVSEGRVAIIGQPTAFAGHALEVLFPKGSVGPQAGGAQWLLALPQSYLKLFLAYRVRFGENFDFVRGGKLPGLVGGKANTGANRPNGTDGWSARMMWRIDGKVVQYVYHPDQIKNTGDDMPWDLGALGQRKFLPGSWHQVEHYISMNTPGHRDGIIEGWFDGNLALRREGLRFRDVDTLAIDALYFSTFFGGSSSSWAATKDERVMFDEFVVSTFPISH